MVQKQKLVKFFMYNELLVRVDMLEQLFTALLLQYTQAEHSHEQNGIGGNERPSLFECHCKSFPLDFVTFYH